MRILHTDNQLTEVLRVLNRRSAETDANQAEIRDKAAAIINEVKERGDAALLDFSARFDQVQLEPGQIKVSPQDFETAGSSVPTDFMEAIRQAKANILAFHQKQLPKDWLDLKDDGIVLGQRYIPVDSAGCYVPGGVAGSTPLVSSLLMNVLPAVVAGVKRIIICTPPNEVGGVNPYLLATAMECGVTEVYKVGGAQAIAAMAFGTETIAPVDVITGPGNQYVTEAKRQVFGWVGLDMLAGPSEILIIADKKNDPAYLAADLLSQAEHGPVDEAGSFLLTNAPDLAQAVAAEVEKQLGQLSRNNIAAASLAKNGAIIITKDLDEAFQLANFSAPEHLELLVSDPWNHLSKIRHAGAVFIGPYSTEPIGDYIAGTNHVLPTNATARFASGLSVDHFIKRTSIIAYNKSGIAKYGPAAIKIAAVEGLDAHANAIKVRLENKDVTCSC
ncbi:MAG: histidinol dehydrogenase [Firmicutes bacterium]|nr:histidinol dehydrogenase [Bacillota bacterium]